MTRILFLGDSAATGFGTVTSDLGTELLKLGEDVRFWSQNEEPGGPQYEPFVGRTAISGHPDGWVAAARSGVNIAERLEGMFLGRLFDDGWTPEAAIILGDVGSLKMSPVLGFIPAGFPVFHYVPVEGVELPPRWAALWAVLRPVAMCQFGADEIAKVTGSRPPVVYHGVSEDFRPVAADDAIVYPAPKLGMPMNVLRTKADCKRFLGLDPKRTVILRTDRLMPRKNYASLLRAVAPVLAKHPEADLLLHCLPLDEGGDLRDEISKYGQLGNQILLSNFAGRADRKVMRALYNAADVYVSVSAEGFGLTIAEALACGIPAVAMDYSSVPEVVGPGGVLVPPAGLIDNVYSHFWAIVDEPKFAAALEPLVADHFLRRRLGSAGLAHVREHFRWATAAVQMRDLISAAVPQALEVAV